MRVNVGCSSTTKIRFRSTSSRVSLIAANRCSGDSTAEQGAPAADPGDPSADATPGAPAADLAMPAAETGAPTAETGQ